jgi:hypothetical protein
VVPSAARDSREVSGSFSGEGGSDMVARDGGGAMAVVVAAMVGSKIIDYWMLKTQKVSIIEYVWQAQLLLVTKCESLLV